MDANYYVVDSSGMFFEVVALTTDDDGYDFCGVRHNETDDVEWVRADTLTALNFDWDDAYAARYAD